MLTYSELARRRRMRHRIRTVVAQRRLAAIGTVPRRGTAEPAGGPPPPPHIP